MTATVTPDDLVAVDDLPDLDTVLPCELVDEDDAGGETVCGQPAGMLLELTCPVWHAGCTEQLLVCGEHDRYLIEHSLALLNGDGPGRGPAGAPVNRSRPAAPA